MSWVNLLDILYPVGSLFFSINNYSPSSIIGGTWTQVKGAVIAASGENGVSAGNYSGSLKISTNQLPSHTHESHAIGISPNQISSSDLGYYAALRSVDLSDYFPAGDNYRRIGSTGGGKLYALQLRSLYLGQNFLAGGYNE